jgi:glyoxylase-like metal-dependent hydrolase (beta-lactamase superfamily II)
MRRLAPLVLILGLGMQAWAQPDFDAVEITTVPLADGLHMLVGQGGNIVVSTGSDGPVLVDDQFAPLAPKIDAAVRAIQDQGVRFVVNTHWHGDHTGGNEVLGESGAVIVAHENVRERMSTKQFMAAFDREVPPSPRAALPVVTFADGVTLHWNDEEIVVQHVANAHTDGDAHVWFRNADVVHAGDTYFAGMFPFIDVSSGGSLSGLIESTDRLLEGARAETKIVPGHGPVSNAAELVAWREMLATVHGRVEAALGAGKTLAAFQAERPFADLADRFGGGFMDAERFLSIVWSDLSRKP